MSHICMSHICMSHICMSHSRAAVRKVGDENQELSKHRGRAGMYECMNESYRDVRMSHVAAYE